MVRTALDILQRPSMTLDVMVCLSEKEEDVGSVMSDLNLTTYTLYSAVYKLKVLGFLFVRRERRWPPHTYVGLTKRGKEAAKLLHPLADIVGSTTEGLELELNDLEREERGEDENRTMVEILKDLRDIKFNLGQWDEAETHAKRTMDIASVMGDSESLSKSLRTLGEIYLRRGESKESESRFSDSFKISTRTEDLNGAAETHYSWERYSSKKGSSIGPWKNTRVLLRHRDRPRMKSWKEGPPRDREGCSRRRASTKIP